MPFKRPVVPLLDLTHSSKPTRTSRKAFKQPVASLRPFKQTETEKDVQRLAAVVIRAIKINFKNTAFSRDDILILVSQMRLDSKEAWAAEVAGMNDFTTKTRYNKVCAAIQHLLAHREITRIDKVLLCLPGFKTSPTQVTYLPTIRRLIGSFTAGSIIDATALVDKWISDQHLPLNIKKMTVRHVLPGMVKEKLIRRGRYRHEYVTI